MKHLSMILLCAVSVASCSRGVTTDTQNGSSLTSVSVKLPDKSKLPASLKNGDLAYCFQVLPVFMAMTTKVVKPAAIRCDSSELKAADGESHGALIKSGDYVSNLKLEAKLDSAMDYQIMLAVGHRATVSGSVPTLFLVPISDSEAEMLPIDISKEYFAGSSEIKSRDMQGKSSIATTIKLQSSAGGIEIGDECILIESGKPVDLEVDTQFEETPIASGN